MRKQTAGQIIRRAREARNLTRPQLAKVVGITPEYLGHLERDGHVYLSEGLVQRFKKRAKVRIPAKAAEKASAVASRWYRNYREKKSA